LRKLYVCGLATDFCVAWTALDARAAGFDTTVIEDASRAIDLDGSLSRGPTWRLPASSALHLRSFDAAGKNVVRPCFWFFSGSHLPASSRRL
jgi:nicotinamidase/pyrazinamidase